MLLMQKASAGEHTANAGRVRHVYALTYAIYALACAQRVKQVVCLKRCRLCMYLCQITCTCVFAHVHSLQCYSYRISLQLKKRFNVLTYYHPISAMSVPPSWAHSDNTIIYDSTKHRCS